jgi:hypothetical protein
MNASRMLVVSSAAVLLPIVFADVAATQQTAWATLYSANKYRNESLDSCLDFKRGVSAKKTGTARCDLLYGNLSAGDNLDWFESSVAHGSRTVIRDLGLLSWNAPFQVPVVPPFPELLPGEQRTITIDTSGADGEDGKPGTAGKPGAPGADADGFTRQPPPSATPAIPGTAAAPARKKNDGTPKIDPVFVKAVAGHLYVIHVVDEANDFYALFRVETIERGDRCVISWKLIEPPNF